MNSNEIAFGPISPKTQELSILASLFLFLIILFLVRKGFLKSGYSILWFFVSILIFILSSFINVLYWFSRLTGIYYPTSAIFSVLIIGIILISIHYSIEISSHETKIKKLAQELGLIKQKLSSLEKKNKSKKRPD